MWAGPAHCDRCHPRMVALSAIQANAQHPSLACASAPALISLSNGVCDLTDVSGNKVFLPQIAFGDGVLLQ
jgi:hypothetical protein